jgi:hypothetical protein
VVSRPSEPISDGISIATGGRPSMMRVAISASPRQNTIDTIVRMMFPTCFFTACSSPALVL